MNYTISSDVICQ